MKTIILSIISILLILSQSLSQNIVISGSVTDKESGESLIGAALYIKELNVGTVTNQYGFYSIHLPKGEFNLQVSFVGYKSETFTIKLSGDKKLNVQLSSKLHINEVLVSADSYRSEVRSTQVSSIKVSTKQVEQLPSFLGESDILKTIQLLPGISSGTEGTGGIHVRGGNASQNLVLLDGVPVYNVNHLFGFFSVFNSDALNSVELFKGAFPARYGGRLSSVIDIRMKEGNKERIKCRLNSGLISSNLSIDGPLSSKTSFILSGRRTYIDWLIDKMQPLLVGKEYGKKTNFGYHFWDLNAKINHQINDRNRLYLSIYSGEDAGNQSDEKFMETGPTKERTDNSGKSIGWGNTIGSIRWNRQASPRLFSNTTVYYSRYEYSENQFKSAVVLDTSATIMNYKEGYNYDTKIEDFGIKVDYDFVKDAKNYFRFGGNYNQILASPGIIENQVYDSIVALVRDTTYTNSLIQNHQLSLYVEDEIDFNSWLKINSGVFLSSYFTNGKNYYSIEPRLSSRFLISENASVKLGYAYITQNIHLLSNAGVGLPTDIWLPATNRIAPETSHQASLSFSYTLGDNYFFTAEGYYKTLKNMIEYKEGYSMIDFQDWQEKTSIGKGKAYGLELHVKKDYGKLRGWLSYSLSNSTRKFNEISFGKEFPFKYSRTHDFNIVGLYSYSKFMDVSASWTFASGMYYTLAMQKYPYAHFRLGYSTEKMIPGFAYRNNFQMPPYHRLDISVRFKLKLKERDASLSIGAYNIYNRYNPYYLYHKRSVAVAFYNNNKPSTNIDKLYQISLSGIMPFVRLSVGI